MCVYIFAYDISETGWHLTANGIFWFNDSGFFFPFSGTVLTVVHFTKMMSWIFKFNKQMLAVVNLVFKVTESQDEVVMTLTGGINLTQGFQW